MTEGGADLLVGVDLRIGDGEHTVILGPNGAGKTTLLRLMAGYRHPTRGSATVLGQRLGTVDLRRLRRRIGFVSTALHPLLQTSAAVRNVVAAARFGATAPVAAIDQDPGVRDAARASLARVGADHLADRRCRTLSQGEWQRVQIARSLIAGSDLLLLDEPMAGLDIGGRERMVADLAGLIEDPGGPTVVLVTHHLEEIPPGTRSAVLLRAGRVVAAGGVDETLTPTHLTAAFGLPMEVTHTAGRWSARIDPAALE